MVDPGTVGSRRLAVSVSGAVLLLTLLFRIAVLRDVFREEGPRLPPFDDQYHALRIVHSALAFPSILDFDPDRGLAGAFCPWPPLYDLAAGGAARLLGGRTSDGVLERAVWFPVAVMSLFLAGLSYLAVRRLGAAAGCAVATALVLSLPLLLVSRLASLDHHFLEPPILLLIALVAVLAVRASSGREAVTSGAWLGVALVLALFVQTAFLFAAALVFAALFLLAGSERPPLLAGSLGFGLAAIAVAAYGLSRPAASPVDAWFLGVPHAAALAAAGAALLALDFLLRRGAVPPAARGLALALGGAIAAALPGALPAFAEGAAFLGGDRWLATIREFQPLFFGSSAPLSDALFLGGGALLVVFFWADASRGRRRDLRALALLSAGYLAAGLASRRFVVVAAPLFAVVGGLVVAAWLRAGRRAAGLLAAALLVGPALAGAWMELRNPPPFEPSDAPAFERAARFLEGRGDGPGRVLGPWSWGHLLHRIGRRPVVVDNFGVMAGRREFEEALAATLETREDRLAAWCRARGVRFLVLENPLTRITRQAETLGLPPALFLRPGPGTDAPAAVTRLAQTTFWWRAYFDRGAPLPPAGKRGEAFRSFRLVYADAERSPDPPPFRGPLVQVWELVPEGAGGS